MINKIYRLVAPRQISVDFETKDLYNNEVLIRPTKLSICAADQRYYTGSRNKDVLKKKLPMALIHEAVGEVVFDLSGEFKVGDTVVLIPNTPVEKSFDIDENYLRSSKFRGSGFDGFMQEYILMDKDRIVKYSNINHNIASFLELISVVMHAIHRFNSYSISKKDTIAVWGDGNVGFITSLILKKMYPNSKILVLGKNEEKLNFFSFVDEVHLITEDIKNLNIDHAFEAVGGKSSQYAMQQIIDNINPQGTISLLGVSENPIEVDTRMILEKGITVVGSSRSGRKDFENAINFLEKHPDVQNHLEKLVSEEIVVSSISDINKAFVNDLQNPFKTVMTWNI